MSSLPAKRLAGSAPKSRFARPNHVRAVREREERQRAMSQSQASSASANRNASVAIPARQQCPNKACPKPNVVDGTCRTCGRVADESNIVAEVQFGETSSGAAMVQGSYVAADQAGVRSMGPAFRRVGGSEDREKSIREARGLMQGYAQQLNISESLVTAGTQVFKLASNANFIQGRTLASVAAVCLYAACRAQPPCKVMLIDLADLVQLNVFKLGRIFKKLNEAVPLGNDGLVPVYPEDLIWRFATKMEFHQDTEKVAEDAVRLVKRMSRDWMVMGRRPSGICGACLLMAARMHNFRRTVREVVYIVKVTNHTIQNRLQEFNFTESSQMSVEDFLKQDFLESSHDPPAFYRKSEDYKKMMDDKTKKRKRITNQDGTADAEDGDDTGGQADTGDQQDPAETEPEAKRQRTITEAGADLSKAPAIKFRRDADGFIIPPHPSQIPQDDPDANVEVDETDVENLERLATEFGDAIDQGVDQESEAAPEQGSRRSRAQPQLPINEEWEQDEQELEDQIEEIFNDPLTHEHALAYSNAEQRARIHTNWALRQRPLKDVSMSADIGEDEFADDPEVLNCLLSPEEARIKELIWVNQNKDWLRQHQEKVFRRKMEAERPKQTRRRRKRARMGEGQTSPASSAAEAAINHVWGSRKTSMAGSVLGVDEEQEAESVAEEEAEEVEDGDVDAEYDETQDFGQGEEFGGGGEFEGGYDEYADEDDYGFDDG
ncbi:hypothetical protein HIM_09237 [Hirsutella minnesotensis 3608]|uniref:Cyclin-like domain-containing protein n=1 Tax=Hirsutella minnesotensis 3608 TaxID=1043627 RepID=A0A0F8A378_9HYPO|nr:hypothetical protein HIM_09237 [Hirsutella minnesotensis 3608]